MLEITVTDTLPALEGHLKDMAGRLFDLDTLSRQMKVSLTEGVKEMVLTGKDGTGSPVPSLKPSTLKHRDGNGPPGAPHGAGSRLLTKMRAESTTAGDSSEIVVSWDMLWAGFVLNRNDQRGINPRTMERLGGTLEKHIEKGTA